MEHGRALGLTMAVVFLVLAGVLSLGAGSAARKGSSTATQPVKRVRVATVEVASETREVRFSGVIPAKPTTTCT